MSCEDRAKSLLDASNDAAKLVRSVHLTFMLVMAYVGIVIASTTDIQLLKISPVTLPLLNVKLPILEFYVLTPWLLLVLHYNMLLQCYLLAQKLHLFNAALSQCDPEVADNMRGRLFGFSLSQVIVGQHHSSLMRFFLNSIIVFSIVIVPLVLLAWAQIRFIPYHSEAITWSHRAVILLDCVLLWIIWPMIILPEAKLKRWLAQNLLWLKSLFGKAKFTVKKQDKISLQGKGQRSLLISSITLLFISWVVAVHPDSTSLGEKKDQFYLTELLFDLPGKPFRQDLYIRGKILVKGDPSAKIEVALKGDQEAEKFSALKEVVGLSLHDRDLRFATFEKCVMPKVILSNSALQGAKITDSFLMGANFRDADLSGANLIRSRLLGSEMDHVNLSGAQMVLADVQYSDLKGANLQGAILVNATLSHSDLSGSDLQGAYLNAANMRQVDFREANPEKATLLGAQINGAIFDEGKLDLIKAKITNGD